MGYQDPSCMHGTPIASHCELCGGVVGGAGPRVIARRQIWRARGAPYGKIAVLEANDRYVLVYQQPKPTTWPIEDFRDEFWYWGAPPDHLRELEAQLEPLLRRLQAAKRPDEVAEARQQLEALVAAHGLRMPRFDFTMINGAETCTLTWPDESDLRAAFKKKPTK